METFKSLILPILLFVYACRKDLAKHSEMICNSQTGKNILKFLVTIGFIFFISVLFFTAELIWLKHKFSSNGFYISLATFIASTSILVLYFYFTFKDLFLPNNK